MRLPGRHTMKRRGFTLIELLVAAGIAAVAAAVVLGGFAAGIRVWERARMVAGPASSARVALEEIRRDLCNLSPSRKYVFRGEPSRMEIPATVGVESNRWPGQIRYGLDREGLRRTVLGADAHGRAQERSEAWPGIIEARFSYADAGPDGKGSPVWVGDWGPGQTNLPVAVAVTLLATADGEKKEIGSIVILPRRYSMRRDERAR